ncbi:Rho-type GTPase-activating protein 1 [Ceratocystis lukuohia]|uniref:Rho-type GTPase-activating protein 1 n=1 Tax=Ceratocystis lukuohia TaxID=2019550 RepID=A0ABR4MUA7_9PEZI
MASDHDASSWRGPERSPTRPHGPAASHQNQNPSTTASGPSSFEADPYNTSFRTHTPENPYVRNSMVPLNGPPGSPARNRSRPPSSQPPPHEHQHPLSQSQSHPQDDISTHGGHTVPRASGDRQRPSKSGRSPSGQARICKKCGQVLTGQFVRALDGTFHLDCFRCRDCGQIVASKFFPVDDENGDGQYPLCETDYFRRLGLLCYKCGNALRGSYITALDRKYHVDHFTCSVCPTVFGASDSYYEHEDQVYCHYHYSTQFAQRCNGCQTAILKQFVEIFRNGQNQHWHPECYMIHKFWNVRLASSDEPALVPGTGTQYDREVVREAEERMEEKVYQIWSVLSAFEESSAACISDMLLHVSNGAHLDGVIVAKRFIYHVEILFQSADRLDNTMASVHRLKNMSYGREAKILCKKIVSFFSLLSKTSETPGGKLGVTQDLLSLVTGLAHYLKLLIRICLQGALKLERESKSSDGIYQFLDDLRNLETQEIEENPLLIMNGNSRLSAKDSDHCALCNKSVEDECAKNGDFRWHINCVKCVHCSTELGRNLQDAHFNAMDKRTYCRNCMNASNDCPAPFEHITKLQQYAFLLKVALARLLEILRTNGALPSSNDDASGYTSDGHHTQHANSRGEPRSQSQPRISERRESSYENTLNEVRRLRSTRLDKHLSSSVRKARTSRIMDGPDGPGSGDNFVSSRDMIPEDGSLNHSGAVDKRLNTMDALTLDDLPRIVAAEQAKELHHLPRADGKRSMDHPSKQSGSRAQSLSRDEGRGGNREMPQRLGRVYFSEMSGLEYFIVRHLAVLTMHPMVEHQFTLDELLGFIESRKPAPFWKNLHKAFKNDGRKGVKKKGVFGVPLEVIVERDGAESTDGLGPGALRIPAILDDIITAMRKMDLSVEGVFRKNGNIKKLGELCESIDRDGTDSVNLMEQPVVQVAALLKRYLRELPDPLLTFKLYKLWLAAAKIPDEEKRKQCLHLTCCLLPKCHRDSLEILFYFLKWAGTFHQIDEESGSKMDVKNLATVIAPNILFANDRALALDSEPMFAVEAVEVMINNLEEMCMLPDYLVSILNDQSLFNSNNSDLTTKDILKRFQDRVGGRQPFESPNEVYNRADLSSRPPPRRYDTDPALWQQETSVRPIMDPPNPAYGSSSQPSTPPNQHSVPQVHSEPRTTSSHQQVPPPMQGPHQQQPPMGPGKHYGPSSVPSILQQPQPPPQYMPMQRDYGPSQAPPMQQQQQQIPVHGPPPTGQNPPLRGYRHEDVAPYGTPVYEPENRPDGELPPNANGKQRSEYRTSANWGRQNPNTGPSVGVAGNN